MPKAAQKKKRVYGPRTKNLVLNCRPSSNQSDDWHIGDAAAADFIKLESDLPREIDLREPWWPVRNQRKTGACVGFATADGLLRWLYAKEGLINQGDEMSARFIWMANKETDDLNNYPTSFLDKAGTTTKLALKVAKKYGCVPEEMLKIDGQLSTDSPQSFFSIAAQYRIASYFNLWPASNSEQQEEDVDTRPINNLKHWLATQGPILTRLDPDKSFMRAKADQAILEEYNLDQIYGGHAVCIVGYSDIDNHFIIRNSWGPKWGIDGFAFAKYDYFSIAFTEAYGAVLNLRELMNKHKKDTDP